MDPVQEWNNTWAVLPPEGVEIEIENGHVYGLVRQGNLWFFPDFSMYVYFVPKKWRFKSE